MNTPPPAMHEPPGLYVEVALGSYVKVQPAGEGSAWNAYAQAMAKMMEFALQHNLIITVRPCR